MEDPSAQDPLVGLRIGEYELRQRIGVGGMGLVYDGIQPLIGKRVAVKVLRPELAAAEEQVARLLAEARAVNAIRHRGIVDIFGFGQVPDGRQYIIMEFLEGIALDAHLADKGRLLVSEALDILDEVLGALGAAHGAGVVHRDLKPSNIFLVQQPDGSRYVKLLDFGLAKMGMPAGRTAQTRTDMVVGTPEYMAPEQARGQPVGPMTDLYALGVVAFEMVTGRLPFTGTSPVDLLMKHVDARPPRPSEFVPELPSALDAFILQMLTKDPEARPGTAETLRRQLQRLRETLLQPRAPVQQQAHQAWPPEPEPSAHASSEPSPEASKSPSAPPPPTTPPEHASEPVGSTGVRAQRRILVPVGLGALALVAAGGVVLALREPTPTPPPQVAVVTPPAPVQPQPQPQLPQPTPDPAQPPHNTAPDATADAGTPSPGLAVTPPENPPQENPPPETPQKARAPTQSALLTRVRKLERDVEARAEAGQPLSPATSRTLTGLRKKAETAGTPEERRQVAAELSAWERLFLRRR